MRQSRSFSNIWIQSANGINLFREISTKLFSKSPGDLRDFKHMR